MPRSTSPSMLRLISRYKYHVVVLTTVLLVAVVLFRGHSRKMDSKKSRSSGASLSPGSKDKPKAKQPDGKPPLSFIFQHKNLRSKVQSAEKILNSEWVARLKQLLGSPSNRKQVSVVFGNYDYLASVLNWLIAAQVRLNPPLTDVIVFCLDEKIFSVLNEREIPSIHINPDDVVTFRSARFSHIWITRLVVYRLINYLGHDVMGIDSDAIVLRNPQDLWEEHKNSDIIGSAGKHPVDLGAEWGFTLCMGMVFFRSTPRIESLWEVIGKGTTAMDDQMFLNKALKSFQIQWQSKERNITDQFIDGQCPNGLCVTVLPYSTVCRQSCLSLSKTMHVWHMGTAKAQEDKMAAAKKGDVWFLNRSVLDLNATDSSLKGIEWLHSLM